MSGAGIRANRFVKAALWRAGALGVAMLLLCGTAMYLLLREAEACRKPDNPRTARFGVLWTSVAPGASVREVVAIVGPADHDRPSFERIPACADPCAVPCSTYYTCVREYEWYSSPNAESGDVYTICADDKGIVRQTSQGTRLQFDLVTSSAGDSLGGLVGLVAIAAAFAVPLAGLLGLWHSVFPIRLSTEWVGEPRGRRTRG
jgi:hypothetical protein